LTIPSEEFAVHGIYMLGRKTITKRKSKENERLNYVFNNLTD
jgi:hypothetical protein